MKNLCLLPLVILAASVYAGQPDNFDFSSTVDGRQLHIDMQKCEPFTDSLLSCRNAVLKITKPGFEQRIRLKTFWFNTAKTVYTGKLDDRYADDSASVIFSDINQDGEDDLIVQTGKNGAYGGASYSVYLSNDGKFIYHRKLSKLTEGKTGLFRVNGNKLSAFAKSGCCEQTSYVYQLEKDKLKLLEEVN